MSTPNWHFPFLVVAAVGPYKDSTPCRGAARGVADGDAGSVIPRATITAGVCDDHCPTSTLALLGMSGKLPASIFPAGDAE